MQLLPTIISTKYIFTYFTYRGKFTHKDRNIRVKISHVNRLQATKPFRHAHYKDKTIDNPMISKITSTQPHRKKQMFQIVISPIDHAKKKEQHLNPKFPAICAAIILNIRSMLTAHLR
jgi:hypothetical protein